MLADAFEEAEGEGEGAASVFAGDEGGRGGAGSGEKGFDFGS